MEKVKLVSLVVDRRVWVRKHLSLDHIECLVSDLQNGDTLPPLKVDRDTLIIVGGNHRFEALKKFYGNTWGEQEVEVEYLDLPPFDEEPTAWWQVALEDNQHLAERLCYHDRNKAAHDLLKTLEDPLSERGEQLARLLRHTPETWHAFVETYHHNKQKIQEQADSGKLGPNPPKAADISRGASRRNKEVDAPMLPGDVNQPTVNAKVMRHAASLTRLLEDVEPDYLSRKNQQMLLEVAHLINQMLGEKAV